MAFRLNRRRVGSPVFPRRTEPEEATLPGLFRCQWCSDNRCTPARPRGSGQGEAHGQDMDRNWAMRNVDGPKPHKVPDPLPVSAPSPANNPRPRSALKEPTPYPAWALNKVLPSRGPN
jgi:hypothetical protein